MQNPLTEFRTQRNLGRSNLAMAAGVGYRSVWEAEAGYAIRLHPALVRFLRAQGYGGDPAVDYENWRVEKGRAVAS